MVPRDDTSGGTRPDFVGVYETEIWAVYGFLGYRTRSRQQAEDLTQQTFERALRAWSRFDPARATPRTWLLAIAHNLLIDHYRREASRPVAEAVDEQTLDRLTQATSRPEPGLELGVSADLHEALGRLDDRQRELIGLRYGADLTGPEIADLTGLSLANVQQILSRTLRQLRDSLTASG